MGSLCLIVQLLLHVAAMSNIIQLQCMYALKYKFTFVGWFLLHWWWRNLTAGHECFIISTPFDTGRSGASGYEVPLEKKTDCCCNHHYSYQDDHFGQERHLLLHIVNHAIVQAASIHSTQYVLAAPSAEKPLSLPGLNSWIFMWGTIIYNFCM